MKSSTLFVCLFAYLGLSLNTLKFQEILEAIKQIRQLQLVG